MWFCFSRITTLKLTPSVGGHDGVSWPTCLYTWREIEAYLRLKKNADTLVGDTRWHKGGLINYAVVNSIDGEDTWKSKDQ